MEPSSERVLRRESGLTKLMVRNLPRLLAGFYILFAIFNTSALISRTGGVSNILGDFAVYQRALHKALTGGDPYDIRSVGLGYLYPPPALLLVEIFDLPATRAGQVAFFFSVNLILITAAVWSVEVYYRVPRHILRLCLFLTWNFAPLWELLFIGQVNVFILFSIFLAWTWREKHPYRAGIALSVGVLLKITPILFLPYFLITRNFKAIGGLFLGLATLVILAILRYGITPSVTYLEVFTNLINAFPGSDNNTQGLVMKLFILRIVPDFSTAQHLYTIYMLVLFCLSAALTWVQRRYEPFFIVLCIGMTLLPNIQWYHHYVLLLLPIFIWVGWSRFNPRVIACCIIWLGIIQVDRWILTFGLLVQIYSQMVLWGFIVWQGRKFLDAFRVSGWRMFQEVQAVSGPKW
jgi:alpha-1,2-mannosyltransferase